MQSVDATPPTISDLIAAISAGAALLSVAVSILAISRASAAQAVSERMFKRQGVIDLHLAWQGTNRIDPSHPITGDVVKGANALGLTAALWNHDVIEKLILHQSYWESFRELFETLAHSQTPVPGMSRRCCDFINSPVRKAYEEMKKFDSSQVESSEIAS